MKTRILICMACFPFLRGMTQVRLLTGVVGGRYHYLESQQANMAAKFNLGYDYSFDAGSNTPDFSGSTDVYVITKELRWNQMNRGLVLGLEVAASEKVLHSIYFEGKTNSASGKRTNTTRGFDESFSLKSKFGGIHYNFTYKPFKRLGFFYDLAFTRYRIRFSASSPSQTEDIQNETMGYRLQLLSGSYKPGSKALNLVNGIGVDLALVQSERFALSLRPEFGFAFNRMSEVNLGVLYNKWIFNLNYVQCGLIIKTRISQ